MKEFNSKVDKKYLQILYGMSEDPELNLGTFLSDCIANNERYIKLNSREVTLLFNPKSDSEKKFTNDLATIISLIELLKKDGLIFVHVNPKILDNALSKTQDNNQPVEGRGLTSDKLFQERIRQSPENYRGWILPTTLSGYILKYVNQFCYVRPELIDYIRNGFKTPEQLRFEKTIFWTRVTAFLAFVGLLIALIVPFCKIAS